MANIIGTICHLSSTAFLDTIIFPTLNQVSCEMKKQIDAINKSHQLDLAAVTNKEKLICQNPPDDQSNAMLSMQLNPKEKVKEKSKSCGKEYFSTGKQLFILSTALLDSSLASLLQQSKELLISSSVIPPVCPVSSDDKGQALATKKPNYKKASQEQVI
ncbi:hypothetical protein RCL_jg11450.t1 [Rhizophagus clarus]|uniref:Uncharacterized protein n=1 Tax=Rhizophagus clarus TaxID=94130 RepID=A0A8H3LAP3_9GLOM|nr:hypothetical protein RCL_jg11450.t1 [Rhizophagus clarus]